MGADESMTDDKDQAALTDAAKAEIAEAVRIVAQDKSYGDIKAIRAHLIPATPENTPPGDGDPTPPPKKEETEPVKKKMGIWWGDRLEENA
jgi:hypothetical protein